MDVTDSTRGHGGVGRTAADVADTSRGFLRMSNEEFMGVALEEARASYEGGGVPVGAVMTEVGEDGREKEIGRGHNERTGGNPLSHGETQCLMNIGRRPQGYKNTVMYTTLAPCAMCAGTIIQFGIPKVVVGEDENFAGELEWLTSRGVEVVLLDHAGCKELMSTFIRENPELWAEDIAEDVPAATTDAQ